MKVYILTEGGKDKGFGHITRCIATAEGFNEFFPDVDVHFIINSDNSVEKLLSEFKSVEYFDWIDSKEKILELFTKDVVVIIDSYYAPYELLQEISEKAILCIYIDDYNRLDYPAGIIVNGTIGAENIPYNKKEDQIYLLGIDYAYLRKEFWNVPDRKINKEAKKVLITFGGNDIRNMIPKILNHLKKYDFEKHVFVTDSMENIEDIKKQSDKNTKLILNPNAKKIKNTMIEVDFAISAAGQTIFEATKCKLPCITVQIVYNQQNNVMFWSKKNVIYHAGFFSQGKLYGNLDIMIEKIKNYNERIEYIKRANVISSNGIFNILKRIASEIIKKTMTIRIADERDIENIFNLSNETLVRKNSFSSKKIEFSDHLKWFSNLMNSKKQIIYIFEYDNCFLAQVKFLLKQEEKSVIGISITEKFRGKGIASEIIKKSLLVLKKIFLK